MTTSRTKIFFAYRHVDKPWGGANNSMRALNAAVRNCDDFEVVDSHQNEGDTFL